MKSIVSYIAVWLLTVVHVTRGQHANITLDPATRQLLDFKLHHKKSMGLLTTSSGAPVDVRNMITLNTDIFLNQFHLDLTSHMDHERVPERVVHAKGTGAFGYFEVTRDVSKYTKAEVFNGIGKKTPIVIRFSSSLQNSGGNDLNREAKGISIKFYTKEGNLDLLCFHIPVYLYKDPILFSPFIHSFKRNPRTNLFDMIAQWDFVTSRPELLHGLFWLIADFGIPKGYRKMDAFPIHTYEINNKHGEKFYVRFSFRSEQGLQFLTTQEATVMAGLDADYYVRDLYNAIENKTYPSWKLEMDVMTPHDVQNIDYNPFDVTRTWKNNTFYTVTIGRMVLNKNVENFYKDVELAAYNPANLVPGISGPVDEIFKARIFAYRDTQNYRLGSNHNKIGVNYPNYVKTYNRDGVPPVRDNMKDVPNYYPNHFNGPAPYVDESKPKKRLIVFDRHAVDLEPLSYFYNYIIKNDAQKQRFASNIAKSLERVPPKILNRVMSLLTLVDRELGNRIEALLVVQSSSKK